MTYDDDEMLDQVVRDNPTRGGRPARLTEAQAQHLRYVAWLTARHGVSKEEREKTRHLKPKATTNARVMNALFAAGFCDRDRTPGQYGRPFITDAGREALQEHDGRRGNPVRGEEQRVGEPPPPRQQLPIRQLRSWGLPQWLDYGTVVHDFQSEDPLIVVGFEATQRPGLQPWVPYAFVENQRTGRRDYVVTARLRRSRQLNPVRQPNPVKRYTYDDLVARLRARGIDVDQSRGDEEPTEHDLARLYGPGSAARRANPEPEAPCEHACSRRPDSRRSNPSKSEKENPIVKGDEASFLVVREKGEEEKSDDDREIRIDPKLQVVHDPDEKIFSKCDALFVRVLRSASKGNPTDTSDASEGTDKAQKYYPSADLTPDETLDHPKGPWQRVAKIDGIRYRRWFDEHEGKGYQLVPFEHHFETPCVLETVAGKRAYRLRLGSGCVWDERGLVIP